MKIGFFDSGFGGLDIFEKVNKTMPAYNYIYLGDTARTPYGSRSPEKVYQFTKEAVDFLIKKKCNLIILACNTASAVALRKLQKQYSTKILGVIVPVVEKALEQTKNNRIGVIGTKVTINSNVFVKEIKNKKVFQKACPLLVPLVENGEEGSQITEIILQNYLQDLLKKDIDTLILGCTHYGLLKNKIKRIVPSINILSEGEVVAEKLKDYLKRHPEIDKKITKQGKKQFYTTDLTENFNNLGSKFFGKKIKAQKITL